MAEQCLSYGELQIPYKVFFVHDKQHKVSIHVHHDGSVQVDAPLATPLADIKQAVSKRGRWLHNHIQRIKQYQSHVLSREYVSGESQLYLGRRYVLKIIKDNHQPASVKLKQGQLQVTTASAQKKDIKALLSDWYRVQAKKTFERRLDSIIANLNWLDIRPEHKLLQMKKQWGSCSPKGLISLNPHLVKAPVRCIDYVLLHELCHLQIHNHSPEFYKLLCRHMTDWESAKAHLDGMAELLLND